MISHMTTCMYVTCTGGGFTSKRGVFGKAGKLNSMLSVTYGPLLSCVIAEVLMGVSLTGKAPPCPRLSTPTKDLCTPCREWRRCVCVVCACMCVYICMCVLSLSQEGRMVCVCVCAGVWMVCVCVCVNLQGFISGWKDGVCMCVCVNLQGFNDLGLKL